MRRDSEPVRQPVSIAAQSRRRLDERVGLRLPRAVALVARAFSTLAPDSRLRRALIRRFVRLGAEALNRGDHEAAVMLYHPACEATFPEQMTGLGDAPGTSGRDERIRFQRRWTAEWGAIRFEPEEIIDLGDRVLVVGRMTGRGRDSGASFDNEWAFLGTFATGRVIRERVFVDHAEAFDAAGLTA